MKELKSLRAKFVISNMLMVTLVIGLAYTYIYLWSGAASRHWMKLQ